VSGLSADDAGTDAELKHEAIDTTGGPLKPDHHRRAIRDARLLPKQRSLGQAWMRRSRKRVFSRDEADRLFSETLRTRNRNLRDLDTDADQLARYGLPDWKSEQSLAESLGISLGELRHFSIHRQRDTTRHYITFAIPKRSGGHRLIHAPKRRLKAIQRKLNELLVRHLPVSPFAHGFLTGRSVASNANSHVARRVVIKLDLKDCFPSIHFGRVRGMLVALGYSYAVATILAVLMTEAPRQPVEAEGKLYHVPVGPRVCVQGAPTSPGLCNAVLRRMDYRLAGLARKHGFSYTRYADDLTFSGDDPSKIKLLVTIASRLIREEGMSVNGEKTRVMRRGRRQRVTGVIVNDRPGLSRKERRRVRAAIHQLPRDGTADPARVRQLVGKLAYLQMLNPAQAAPLQAALAGR
jgi:retron-type reverse transcriptase